MGVKNVPANAYQVGTDSNGKMYYGRCNLNTTVHVGKITDAFYWDNGSKETTGCDTHDILVC